MLAGKLDRRVTLRRFTSSTDGFNNPVETWADLATVWAAVEFVRDGERFRSGEVGASQMIRVQIRYSAQVAGIDAKDRLMFDGREYAVNGVKELGRRVGLELTATARAD